MAKGDTVKVLLRTPVGTHETLIDARGVGTLLAVEEPRSTDLYLAVEERNRNGGMIRRFLFAKNEVLSVTTGQKAKGKAK